MNKSLNTKKIALVTGANSGIGYETTIGLINKGFEVIMACRDLQKANEAKVKILCLYPKAQLNLMLLDLSSLASVNEFAEAFKSQYQHLNLLINNAGIMMSPFKMTVDGFENQLATNYLGHFALTGLLLPLLENNPDSRVISLSSLAFKWSEIHFDDIHSRNKYSKRTAYGQSKRACLMFAIELQRRLVAAKSQTISLVAHPGLSKTNLDRYFPSLIRPLGSLFLQPANMGALPVLHAALINQVKGGDFIGPDGFKQFKGYPTKVLADSYAYDKKIGKRLWELSEDLTKISYLND